MTGPGSTSSGRGPPTSDVGALALLAQVETRLHLTDTRRRTLERHRRARENEIYSCTSGRGDRNQPPTTVPRYRLGEGGPTREEPPPRARCSGGARPDPSSSRPARSQSRPGRRRSKLRPRNTVAGDAGGSRRGHRLMSRRDRLEWRPGRALALFQGESMATPSKLVREIGARRVTGGRHRLFWCRRRRCPT